MDFNIDELAEALINNEGAIGLTAKELLAFVKTNRVLRISVWANIADRWDKVTANEIFGLL